MTNTVINFLQHAEVRDEKLTERLVGSIWWHTRNGKKNVTFEQIINDNKEAGFPALNKTRVRNDLKYDKRIVYEKSVDSFSINVKHVDFLDAKFGSLTNFKHSVVSDTVLALSDFVYRDYITKVINQINRSYDEGLWDCCAVMMRRLLETLIIEIYESLGRAADIKDKDNFHMFSGLLSVIKNDTNINLGRQTKEALESFKKLADSSAHNRAFCATKHNIDSHVPEVRLAANELFHRIKKSKGA